MKKRLQVLMLAAVPILGALGLFALKEYQLPENVFRRETRGVTTVRFQPPFRAGNDPLNPDIYLSASDSARFVASFHLERHRFFGAGAPMTDHVTFFRGDHEVVSFMYSPDFVYSTKHWWQGGYPLTPSSKRELNSILKKYGRQLH